MRRILILAVAFVSVFLSVNAQIGYQITVFDQTKNAPKANQTVSATVTITDSSGATIVSESYTGTTDEFGILSMTIGNANSFANANWQKLPFWVSATVDGVTVSRTQLLNVPVAEYAKKTGKLTKEILCGKTWSWADEENSTSVVFGGGNTGTITSVWGNYRDTTTFNYVISGDMVICTGSDWGDAFFYNSNTNKLCFDEIVLK